MAGAGFAVAIKLLDLASEPLAKINRNIREMEKSAGVGSIATRAKMAVAQADVRAYGAEVRKLAGAMRTASGESKDKLQKQLELATGNLAKAEKAAAALNKELVGKGKLSEAADALRGIREQTKGVAEGLTAAFTPLEVLIGGIAAGGIIGGLALMAERFAQVGAAVGRTSAGLGLATGPLQQFTGAADLAGVGAEAMTTSLQGLAQGIYQTRNGLDPTMFRVAQRWGLDLTKGATDAEKGANLMLQVADLFKNNPMVRGNTQLQKTIMGIFHIEPGMISYLQQGADAIRDLMEQTKRHGILTVEQTAHATELEHAYIGLRQSVTGVTNALGDQMSRWMTPMLMKWSEWLDQLRESPGAMKAVETGAEGLAAVFGVTLFAGVAKLIGKLNAFWALPAIKFLVANPWLSGLIAGGAVLWPTPLNKGEDAYIKAHPELFPQMPGAGGPQGLLAPHGAASQNLAANNPGNLKAAGDLWQTFESPEAGIRGVGDWLSRWYGRGKRTISDLVSTYSPPKENDTPALIARAAGRLNVDPNAPIDVNDPNIKRALVQAFLRNEWGGVLPRGYTDEQIAAALGGPRKSNLGSLQNSFLPSAP